MQEKDQLEVSDPNTQEFDEENEEPIKPFYARLSRNQQVILIATALILFVMACIGIAAYNMKPEEAVVEASPSPSPIISPTPNLESSPSPSPSVTIRPSIRPSTQPSPTPSPTPSVSPSPSPRPTPTPSPNAPNPPRMNISYPSENQVITMKEDQQLCVVDTPSGGNTSGLKRKHQFNNSRWSSYVDHYTLCLDPQEGQNTLTLQYRNRDGDESTQYTRQFIFQIEE